MNSLIPDNTEEEPWNYDWGTNKENLGKFIHCTKLLLVEQRKKCSYSSSEDFPKKFTLLLVMNKFLVKVYLQDMWSF